MSKNKYMSVAKTVINLEIDALQKLKKNINISFINAVKKIANCQSKVILCGVGKSGLIASKISATLSSVGTPSFSLSAEIHMWSRYIKKDILVIISNSVRPIKNIIHMQIEIKYLIELFQKIHLYNVWY